MKRRRFLELSAAAIAGASIPQCWGAGTSPSSLRAVAVPGGSGPALLLLSATASVAERGPLVVSGWVEESVLHLMLEKPLASSRPDFVFSGLQPGRRYRVRLMNATELDVPVQLPFHRLELKRVEQAPVAGIFTQTLWLKRYSVVEACLFV